jgi:hypothetical protein
MDQIWSMDVINWKVFPGSRNQEFHNRLCQIYSGANIENTSEMEIFKLSIIDKIQVFPFMCIFNPFICIQMYTGTPAP